MGYMSEKNNKLRLILIIFIICITSVLTYSYIKEKSLIKEINVTNTKLYPSYSKDIKEYVLYTNEEEIEITCDIEDSENVEGCNESIKITEDIQSHEIITSTTSRRHPNRTSVRLTSLQNRRRTLERQRRVWMRIVRTPVQDLRLLVCISAHQSPA